MEKQEEFNGDFFKQVKAIDEECQKYLKYVKTYNDCAYSDRIVDKIIENSKKLSEVVENYFAN